MNPPKFTRRRRLIYSHGDNRQFIVDADNPLKVVSEYPLPCLANEVDAANADLDIAAPDLYAALEVCEAYEEIRFTGTLSDDYHRLIAPWKEQIEAIVGEEIPMNERFPGWHRDAMYLMANRLRAAALAKARGGAQ